MNTKHAQYILTVLQEGSITAASKKLYVSQPSLSQMIKLVENNLGAPIFNRGTDPITLTYAGQKYVEAAKQVLTINQNLAREIEEINHEDHGTIRLGIPVQRAMQVLPYAFPRFQKLFPMVDLELNEFGSATVESMVLEGSLDLACLTTYPKYEELTISLLKTKIWCFSPAKIPPSQKGFPPAPRSVSRKPKMNPLSPARQATASAPPRTGCLPCMTSSPGSFSKP